MSPSRWSLALALVAVGACRFDGGGPQAQRSSPLSDSRIVIADGAAIDHVHADGSLPDARHDSARSDGPAPDATHDTRAPDTTHDSRAPDLTVDTAPPPLFETNFDDGIWPFVDSGTGSFSVSGGIAQMDICNTLGFTGLAGTSWTDMRASVRFRADRDCGASQIGLRVRVASLSPCTLYSCVADIDNDQLYLSKKNNNCGTSSALTSRATPNLAFGAWYRMEMEAVGSQLRCTVSGGDLSAPVSISHTDSNPIPAGSAGVGGYDIEGSFDDFRVELP